MRKLAVVFMMMFSSMLVLIASSIQWPEITDFEVTAYKNAPRPVCEIVVTSSAAPSYEFSSSGENTIDGKIFDVTAMYRANQSKVQGAISVKMLTNLRYPNLSVTLTLYPFVQTQNQNKKANAVYKVNYVKPYIDCVFNDVTYRYTGALAASDYAQGTKITASSTGGIDVVITGNVTCNKSFPAYAGRALAGMREGQLLMPECNLDLVDLSIDSLDKDREYVANVGITITAD